MYKDFQQYGTVYYQDLGVEAPNYPDTEEGQAMLAKYFQEPKVIEKIKAFKMAKVEQLMKFSDINKRWRKRTLETFEERDNTAKAMKKLALEYVSNWEKNKAEGKGIYMHGAVGIGKTHLICGIAQELIERYQTRVMYFSVPSLLTKVDPFLKSDESKKLMNYLKTCELLILDDLDKTPLNDYTLRFLYLVVNHRYENDLPIIITSNRTIDEVVSDMQSERMAMAGEAVIDRIVEMCKLVLLKKRTSERSRKH